MTVRAMKNVQVEAGEDGLVRIRQELFDLNEPDPCIELTGIQTPMVAGWLLEAAGEAATNEIETVGQAIPVSYYSGDGPVGQEEMNVHCNARGMVVLAITDDVHVEISPAMAKRLRERLSVAIRASLTTLLKPDDGA